MDIVHVREDNEEDGTGVVMVMIDEIISPTTAGYVHYIDYIGNLDLRQIQVFSKHQ